jgi:formyltetrahydrofolate-dependent phosphoribosylglycinamide formyltransferase
MAKLKVGVLISGRGSNMAALIEAAKAADYPAEIVCVVSNVAAAQGLKIAEAAGIPTAAIPHKGFPDRESFDRVVSAELEKHGVELVALAGFMRIQSPWFPTHWQGRIVNIHPSLLPYHPGPNAYKQAWEEGVRVSGCTAHFVTEQLDAGPVILQDVFHIRVGEDTLEEVKERGRALEAKVLSQAVQLFLNDQLVVKDKKVIFRPGRFPGAAGAA